MCLLRRFGQAEGDCWPKRALFREWVAEARRKLNASTNAEVAPIMRITPNTLNKYLAKSPTHRASNDALERLGDFLGKDYRGLLDGPEGNYAWSTAPAEDREFAMSVLNTLAATSGEEKEFFKRIVTIVMQSTTSRDPESSSQPG